MPLNNAPNAVRFLEGLATKTYRNAIFGDPNAATNDRVRGILNTVHSQISASLDVQRKLDKDVSRHEVEKHYRGRQEAETLNGVLASAREQLTAEADRLEGEATTAIDGAFQLDPTRAIFASRKLDWLDKQWADPNGGSAAISKQVKQDPELAALIIKGDAYVLGFPEETRMNLAISAVKAHLPDAHAAIETAKSIRETASKYDGAMNSVRFSFAVDSVADKMATRVE